MKWPHNKEDANLITYVTHQYGRKKNTSPVGPTWQAKDGHFTLYPWALITFVHGIVAEKSRTKQWID
jgi:hypothetical protein